MYKFVRLLTLRVCLCLCVLLLLPFIGAPGELHSTNESQKCAVFAPLTKRTATLYLLHFSCLASSTRSLPAAAEPLRNVSPSLSPHLSVWQSYCTYLCDSYLCDSLRTTYYLRRHETGWNIVLSNFMCRALNFKENHNDDAHSNLSVMFTAGF